MTALKFSLALAFSLLAIPAHGAAAQEPEWVTFDSHQPDVRNAYAWASVSRGNSDIVTLVMRQHVPGGNALGLPSYYQVIFDCSVDVIRVSAGMLSLDQDFVFLNDAESIAGHDLEQLFEQMCFYPPARMTTLQPGTADLGVSVVTLKADPGSPSLLPVFGVRVEALLGGSSADLAGIRVGDHIVGYGNAPIISADHLEGLLDAAAIGDTVHITLVRNGSRQTVETVLQAYPGFEESAVSDGQSAVELIFDEAPRGYLGVELTPMTTEFALAFGLADSTGDLVVEVEPGSPAEFAGLSAFDVIEEVNAQPVTAENNVAMLISALGPGTVAMLRVRRDNRPMTLAATLGERPAAMGISEIPAFVPESVPSIAPPREIAPAHVFNPPSAP